jgi:hypothetical protein
LAVVVVAAVRARSVLPPKLPTPQRLRPTEYEVGVERHQFLIT